MTYFRSKVHCHNHIIFCAVDFAEHKKYIFNRKSYAQIRRVSDRLCRENRLSVVAPGAERGKQYAEWDAQRKGTNYKQKLKIAIDRLIPISKDLDDLLRRLEAEGYEIKRGKYTSFRAPGQERFARTMVFLDQHGIFHYTDLEQKDHGASGQQRANGRYAENSRTSTASCPPTVGRNRTKPCSFSDIHTLFSNNLMCVRHFAIDNRTLFLYNIMCDCQSEVRSMNAKEKIEELLEASEDGTITAAQVTEAGLHRSVLQEFVKSGEMYRFGRGLYVRSSAWEDDFYLLQRKYGRGIYSHDTALYLLGYSDRTPAKYTMTFPKGYNAPSLKQENLIIKRVVPENYEFGRIEIESPSGNPIRVYDLERTLCDILRGSGSDVQIVGEAMKRYAASKDKNIHKLMQYADQLRVKPKVLRYMEVLL